MGEPTKRKSGAWSTVLAIVLVVLFQVGKYYGPELLAMWPVKVHAVEVSAETETGDTPEFYYSLRLPVFTTSDPGVQRVLDALAKEISDKARGEVLDMEARVKEDAASAKEDGYELPPYDYRIDFVVTYNRDNLLSLSTSEYFYYGGAHGTPLVLSYTVDLRSGKTLSLMDLFTDERTAKVILAHGVLEGIEAEPDRFFPDAADHAGVRDDQQFYLKDGQVVLHYTVYDLAPYAGGLPEFAFYVDELENVLQPRIRRSLEKSALEDPGLE